jgi:hypothetical protein
MAKTNNIVQTTREEIIKKTAETLVWDRNGPPGPKRERMMMMMMMMMMMGEGFYWTSGHLYIAILDKFSDSEWTWQGFIPF